jgi:hypothetical protein
MSTLRTNALEGVDAKNSITIVAGAGNITTTNVQEGLVKAWSDYTTSGSGNSINGSFNVSSISDVGTGDVRLNYTNNMADENYSGFASAVANAQKNFDRVSGLDDSFSSPNATGDLA